MPPARQGDAAEERTGEGDEMAHCAALDLGSALELAAAPACHVDGLPQWLAGYYEYTVARPPIVSTVLMSYRVADRGKNAKWHAIQACGAWSHGVRCGARWHVIDSSSHATATAARRGAVCGQDAGYIIGGGAEATSWLMRRSMVLG